LSFGVLIFLEISQAARPLFRVEMRFRVIESFFFAIKERKE
jgi:hypothetical protein